MKLSAETLSIAREALSKANPPALLEVLEKAGWTQSSSAISGITYYDLEAPSKHLVPFLSPLRNIIPRSADGLGIQAAWRAVTGVNTANLTIGVAESNRGGTITSTTSDYLAKFVTLGLEDQVSDEAIRAAKNFEDLRATAQMNLLNQFMVEEERVILGGVGTAGAALGTTPTPSGVLQTGVGSMTAQATTCYCVALTLEGFRQSSVSGGVATTTSRTRAGVYGGSDTVNLGHAAISAVSNTVTTASSNLGVNWSVASVPGAVAYAWFTGLSGIGNNKLTAITTVNRFNQLADATGTQLANAAGLSTDQSNDTLVFDGIIAQAAKSGSGAYVKSLDNAGFTEVGDGTIAELETMMQTMWDTNRLGIKRLFFNSIDYKNFRKHMLSKSGSPTYRVNVASGDGPLGVTGGNYVPSYFNAYTGDVIDIQVHPYLPQGTAVGFTDSLPYKLNDVPSVLRMKMRLDYYSEEWPRNRRAYEFGVYEDGVLQCYFPGAIALLQNIGNS